MASVNDQSLQNKMESIFHQTCETWQNCTQSNILSFLRQCQEQNIDSQYCMSWVEQHKSQIPDWKNVSEASLDWMNQNTSTGSSFSST
ncbi:hypothetical protein [Paenibacillus faecalis]|uniref:hypothetical protein n=1 Tax=Paenibacillus faecalis TaxID=2079532 RepID=UPI000D100DB1|nr:hypothetical protein [Paenibacillus faecalis]